MNTSSFNVLDATWFTEAENASYDEFALRKSRSKAFLDDPNGKRLISYLLTFSLDNSSILVEKEVSQTKYARQCIYTVLYKGQFPGCVI
jgi:hypothetical protein